MKKQKKEEKIQLVSFREHRAELMKKPAFKNAYDELEFEFQLIRAVIDARINKGVTQKKLAEKMGTKQSAIARFESGRANPTLDFLKKLSRVLDVKLTVMR
jgi:ribosome-binding protein aMBF1 (putative translation factor)